MTPDEKRDQRERRWRDRRRMLQWFIACALTISITELVYASQGWLNATLTFFLIAAAIIQLGNVTNWVIKDGGAELLIGGLVIMFAIRAIFICPGHFWVVQTLVGLPALKFCAYRFYRETYRKLL